jgi:hypothetical protein
MATEPATISCPVCRQLMQLPSELEGKPVCCPSCEAVFLAQPQAAVTAVAERGPGPSRLGPSTTSGRGPMDGQTWNGSAIRVRQWICCAVNPFPSGSSGERWQRSSW